ncbi:MAG: hypothetical protein HC911_16810 [Chloroflexaceae bacterium]|nr:hypothetical protein [Chloroflexaceae bacterium]
MCTQFTPLAKYDHSHAISQCEHGTIHLTWEHCTFRLAPEQFTQIADLLGRTQQTGPHPLYHDILVVLVQANKGVNVWIGAVGLALSFEGFELLCALVLQAAHALQSVHIYRGHCLDMDDLAQQPTVPYYGSQTFSTN